MTHRTGRILLVDDDQRWLEELSETLKLAGYAIETASSIAEANVLLENGLFHLVILDIRMQDNDNSNKDGISLLHSIARSPAGRAIKVVMLSAYATRQDVRNAFKENVIDVLDKNDFDNEEFVQSLPQIFTQKIPINLDLVINWPNVRPERIVQNLGIGDERVRNNTQLQSTIADELDDLLCRLFSDAESILIRQVTPGYSGAGVLSVRPTYDNGAARAVIVKFGDTHKIEEEAVHFKRYAEPYIGGARSTTIKGTGYTPHLGGVIYSLLGAANNQFEDFGTFYQRTGDIDRIKSVITHLFKQTCGSWYANPGKQGQLDLQEAYTEHLGLTWDKLNMALLDFQKSVQGKDRLVFNALKSSRRFTNPISESEGKSQVHITYTTITHGDFNQSNILVDGDGYTWLIDFQGTGPSHILRDIIALDIEIRCKLLKADEATLRERLEMEEMLCSATRFSDLQWMQGNLVTTNSALARTYALIIHLRMLAHELMPHNQDEDMGEYYAASFYYALKAFCFRSMATGQREHALLSASLLFDKMNLANQ